MNEARLACPTMTAPKPPATPVPPPLIHDSRFPCLNIPSRLFHANNATMLHSLDFRLRLFDVRVCCFDAMLALCDSKH